MAALQESPTSQILRSQYNVSDMMVLNQRAQLRSDFSALPAHKQALADCPRSILSSAQILCTNGYHIRISCCPCCVEAIEVAHTGQ